MRNLSRAVAFILLLSTNAAFAGHAVGNGGHGLLCDLGGGETSLDSLDLYDSRRAFGPSLLDSFPHVSEVDLAARIIDRVALFDEARAALYRDQLHSFFREAIFVSKESITRTEDDGRKLYPDNCRMVQIIVQMPNPGPHLPRYLIQTSLWQKLSAANKAALIVHEIFYRDALKRGQTNSISTRSLNAVLLAERFSNLSSRDLFDLFTQFYFNEFQIFLGNGADAVVYRYFPEFYFNYAQAEDYCRKLIPRGEIADLERDADIIFGVDSAITRGLADGTVLWSQGEKSFDVASRQILQQGFSVHAFVCRVTRTWVRKG